MKVKEYVARAMCERDGHDPDAMVFEVALAKGPLNSFIAPDDRYLVPAWVMYAQLAATAITALEDFTTTTED
jgi:hypothetical protein